MKRLVSAVFVLILLVCVLAVSTSAAEEPTATLSASTETAHRGDTVTVTISLTGVVKSVYLIPEYDKSVLEWVGGEWLISGSISAVDFETYGDATIALTSYTKFESTPVLKLQFKVRDGAKFDTTSVNASVSVEADGLTMQDVIRSTATSFDIVCDHSFIERAVEIFLKNPATCQTAAEYWKSCEICNVASDTESFFNGEKAAHKFVKEVRDENKYLKTEAGCETPAIFYKSCECGEKGTETFEGDALGHDWATVLSFNGETHWYDCNREGCNEKNGETDHNFNVEDSATDENKASGATCTEPAKYYYYCACGKKSDDKVFAYGPMLDHDYQNIVGAEFANTPQDCVNAATYFKSCKDCGLKHETETFVSGEAKGHSGGNATCTAQAICQDCGQPYGEMLEHSYTEQVVNDTFKASGATCTNKATYYYSCSCGAKGTETFESGETLPHEYDEIVHNDFRKSSATCTEQAVYYKSCKDCKVKNENETFKDGETLPHNYKEIVKEELIATPKDCLNAATYYKSCEDCGAQSTETFASGEAKGHSGGNATCTAQAICQDCGQPYGEMLEHSYTEQVVNDTFKASGATCTNKATYYYSCSCGAKGTATFESGETLPHTYDKQNTDDKYIADAAKCDAKATYYYSCECGAKGTETFETGTVLGHSWKTALTVGETSHWYDCVRCDAKNGETAHSYSEVTDKKFEKTPATCTSYAVYYKSCECGKTNSETFNGNTYASHSYGSNVTEQNKKSDATCTSAAVYYMSCNACGAKGTSTFNYGSALGHIGGEATCTSLAKCTRCNQTYGEMLPHTYDKEVQNDKFKKNDATCTEKLTYYKSCVCGEKGTETFTVGEALPHSYVKEIATDTYLKSAADCDSKAVYYKSCECGAKGEETFEYGEALGHTYTTEWKTSESAHWYECTVCGAKKDEAAHVAGPEATEDADQVCTVCGYVITPKLAHTHEFKTEWSTNANEHWHECRCGDKQDIGAHAYDNACDTTCNTCGYVRDITHAYATEIKSDENGHWYECTVCGAKKDEAAHNPGPMATEEAAQTCTVCGYVIKEKLEHTHAFGDEWKSDGENHWHECKCGEKSELVAHKWNDGVVTTEPTEDAEGEKTFTCGDCGATRTEKVEKLEKKKGCGSSKSSGLALATPFICLPAGLMFNKKKKFW